MVAPVSLKKFGVLFSNSSSSGFLTLSKEVCFKLVLVNLGLSFPTIFLDREANNLL